MLEGMAPAQARAVRADGRRLLLYAPVVHARRLRRQPSPTWPGGSTRTPRPENFLRALFDLAPRLAGVAPSRRRGSARAVAARATACRHAPRRQDRRPSVDRRRRRPFANEPDTDFTQAGEPRLDRPPPLAATAAGGRASPIVDDDRRRSTPSVARAAEPVPALGGDADGRSARRVLARVAEVDGRRARSTPIAVMADEAGKTVARGRPRGVARRSTSPATTPTAPRELDDARTAADAASRSAWSWSPPPWNFPYAIPAGGVLAALAAGNAVILKPAPRDAAHGVARWPSSCWAAGRAARRRCSSSPCPDDEVGRRLVTHPDVDAVVLTGVVRDRASCSSAGDPTLHLLAETSGKNAIVVTAAADLDLAIRDLVRSAFGHAGQKCSAASLAIVEASVHDDAGVPARAWPTPSRTLRVGPADRSGDRRWAR